MTGAIVRLAMRAGNYLLWEVIDVTVSNFMRAHCGRFYGIIIANESGTRLSLDSGEYRLQ